jgi:hypothetical protein
LWSELKSQHKLSTWQCFNDPLQRTLLYQVLHSMVTRDSFEMNSVFLPKTSASWHYFTEHHAMIYWMTMQSKLLQPGIKQEQNKSQLKTTNYMQTWNN